MKMRVEDLLARRTTIVCDDVDGRCAGRSAHSLGESWELGKEGGGNV